MAVVLAFRAAIFLAPLGYRMISQGPVGSQGQLPQISRELWARLHDPAESDSDLSIAVSDATGIVSDVATYEGTFELRKLQVTIGRTSGAATPEDDAVITFHFLKLAAGSPSSDWQSADFTTVEGALSTYLAYFRTNWWRSLLTVKQYRWYATGPQVDDALGGPGRTGPPRRIVDVNAAGSATGDLAAPQVAASVTEKTSDRTAWGRVYFPGPVWTSALVTMHGRLQSATQTAVANAADTFYEACRTAGTPVVVYSAAKPERENASGGTLPAKAARALTVDEVQVDDLFDVIRSRRWNSPLLKVQRAISA